MQGEGEGKGAGVGVEGEGGGGGRRRAAVRGVRGVRDWRRTGSGQDSLGAPPSAARCQPPVCSAVLTMGRHSSCSEGSGSGAVCSVRASAAPCTPAKKAWLRMRPCRAAAPSAAAPPSRSVGGSTSSAVTSSAATGGKPSGSRYLHASTRLGGGPRGGLVTGHGWGEDHQRDEPRPQGEGSWRVELT